MKKPFLILITLMCLISVSNAQECELPVQWQGNTGSNMTVMMLPGFMESITLTSSNAYIAAVTQSGMIIGSAVIDGVNQQSAAIWGDDTQTPDTDGALASELFDLFLVDGEDLFSITTDQTLEYITQSLIILNYSSINLIDCSIVPGCIHEWADNYDAFASEDDGSCFLYGCLNPSAFNFNEHATDQDNSCLFSESYMSALEQDADSLQQLAETNSDQITDLENQLSNSLQNQDDGVYQADLDALQIQLDTLQVQLSELAANSLDGQVLYFENQIDLENPSQYQVLVQAYATLAQAYYECNPNVYGLISVPLDEGWNTVGYNLLYETTAPYQFASIVDDMILVKSNDGNIYWPHFNFNGIGNLIPGLGYQVRMVNQANFEFIE